MQFEKTDYLKHKFAYLRRAHLLHRRDHLDLPVDFPLAKMFSMTRLVIIGKGRVVDDLTQLAHNMKWNVWHHDINNLFPRFYPNDAVVIVSDDNVDPKLIERALKAEASYVGLVCGHRKAAEALHHIQKHPEMGQIEMLPLYLSAGMDIETKTSTDTALGIALELYKLTETAKQ